MNKKNVKNNNDEKLILAVLVKEARLMKNISQRELSRRTGVDNNTLAKIERGIRKKPNLKSLKSISNELDIPFSKLLEACHYDQISEDAYLQFEENMRLINSINDEDSDTIATRNLKDKLDKLDEDTKEKIQIQENYINSQTEDRKETLEEFNRQHPMWKDVEISFWIPVKEYKDIEKTLDSVTTNQTLDPKKYEVVILFNRPNDKTEFDKATEEKILKFILNHPEYNIHLFKHTFDFPEWEGANLWEIYKLLWDTIVHRNTQRKNISWMDMKKVIMETGMKLLKRAKSKPAKSTRCSSPSA